MHSNAGACEIGVYDTTSGEKVQVPFDLPAMACRDTEQIKNGKPLWIKHKYHVEVVR
ncbi:hypothetical protein [Pseudoduganella violaceinigra]|uniref:hypothetical protein n=1 Tax=Pseudoduganella violaceinigra TaxID=246602 RepID=UPI00040CA242|nr:hypothetical protein [Pseudoduganella violaceinigra]